MNKISENTIEYFRPKENYFWRWADNGTIIEWIDGSTICYRDELLIILNKINLEHGIPPMGSILLALSACQNSWKESNRGLGILSGIADFLVKEHLTSKEILTYHIHEALRFMDIINELPNDLKSRPGKDHLLYEIFNTSDHAISQINGKMILDEFASGRLDEEIYNTYQYLDDNILIQDLRYLTQGIKRFPSSESLKLRIEIGIDSLPLPNPTTLPETPLPDLLEQLEQDSKTEGISRLTKHLIAALNIPMHSAGSSDLPLGGVSDITNRGNLDKLLLSEWAQDDLVLTARLVNNEALYLHREEPPDHINKERIIALDTTIKMWGVPRVFGLSAALSIARQTKNVGNINTYAIGGNEFEQIDLTSKKGVLSTLQCLDPSLDFKIGLKKFFSSNQSSNIKEYVVISNENNLADYQTKLILSEIKNIVIYLVAVNRDGELKFFEFLNGTTKLINSSKYDLEELLFATASKKVKKQVENLPDFFDTIPCPLNYPTAGIKPTIKNSFYHERIGVLGITDAQRLLYWPSKDSGARELLHFIEPGDYHFGFDGVSTFFLLLINYSKKIVILYKIETTQNAIEDHVILNEIKEPAEIIFFENFFYFKLNKDSNEVIILDCFNHQIVKQTHEKISNAFDHHKRIPAWYRENQLKRHINNGYSVLQKAHKIYINKNGNLTIDNHHLSINFNDSTMRWIENRMGGVEDIASEKDLEREYLTDNTLIKFYRKIWDDGSEALVDSRGLLHLKSSDSSLTEMTFVLAIGKPTACWTSNGFKFGYRYFSNMDDADNKQNFPIIENRLRNFIDRLR